MLIRGQSWPETPGKTETFVMLEGLLERVKSKVSSCMKLLSSSKSPNYGVHLRTKIIENEI